VIILTAEPMMDQKAISVIKTTIFVISKPTKTRENKVPCKRYLQNFDFNENSHIPFSTVLCSTKNINSL
jgi:hypothetical protein